MNINKEELKNLREEFPEGTRVSLLKMDDIQAPPINTEGTVIDVDDAGTIHVAWDNGSLLGVVYGEDCIHKMERNNNGEKI